MRLLLKSCLLLLSLSATVAWAADDADAVLGQWLTADGKAKVEVVKHGDSYDGSIVWLKEPNYPADDKQGMGGRIKVDRENPDKSLQSRPIIGLPLSVDSSTPATTSGWTGTSTTRRAASSTAAR